MRKGKEMIKTMNTMKTNEIILTKLEPYFSVCKVLDFSKVNLDSGYCFTGKTDQENSLVCETKDVPDNTTEREDGWRGFRIEGVLDFSLTGILAGVSAVLAENHIGIFAVSTYNTDYIFVKQEQFDKGLEVLAGAGYQVAGQ